LPVSRVAVAFHFLSFLHNERHPLLRGSDMCIETEFEQQEAVRARLDGFETVMAAALEALFSKDRRAKQKFASRLAMLELLTRQQNAHADLLDTVGRFRELVTDEDDLCLAGTASH
jgi:hypothetical protein